MLKIGSLLISVVILLQSLPVLAAEIYLNNGDRVSGEVVKTTATVVTLRTSAMGEITINRSLIDRQKTQFDELENKPVAASEVKASSSAPEIKKTLSLGYTKAGGNTQRQQGTAAVFLNRKTKTTEATMKYNAFYSSTNEHIDGKKFYGMLRYANSFGSRLQWYNFYKFEGDQDRLADIGYRLIPSIGRGYWFSDTEDLKALTEIALGYQHTRYRSTNEDTDEAILVPRFFIDKRLLVNLHLSEDLTVYPSLSNPGDYRFRSEASLINKITEHWAFKIQFIDDFNSNPATSSKKNDYQLITALDYNF